jgi:drug/metabolite transporter (DMT)-like permease
VLLVLAAALCWSGGGLTARSVTTDVWTTIFWRSVTCALLLAAVLAGQGRVHVSFRAMGSPGVLLAACFATSSICFINALRWTTVANTLLFQSLVPFLAGLLAWLWLGERVTRRGWLAMVAAMAGTAIVVAGSVATGSIAGDGLAFVMSLTFAIATVLARRQRGTNPMPAVCLAAVFGALVAVPLARPLTVSAVDFGLLALFGAGQLGLGLILFTAGARYVPAAEAALIGLLETVLGPLWVALVLREVPPLATLAGGALMLGALGAHLALELWRPAIDPAVVAGPPSAPARDRARREARESPGV